MRVVPGVRDVVRREGSSEEEVLGEDDRAERRDPVPDER